jgi:hypothetical protein
MRHFVHPSDRDQSIATRRLEAAITRGLEMLERRVLLCATPEEAFAAQIAGAKYHVHELLDASEMPKTTARAVAQAGATTLYGDLTNVKPAKRGQVPDVHPTSYAPFMIDAAAMRQTLSKAPMEFTAAARNNPLTLALPMPDGSYERFKVVEAPIMEAGLAKKFPDIKTYRGQGIEDPHASVRLDMTSLGFHAQVLSPHGAFYIDPYYHLDQGTYVSYFKSANLPTSAWKCLDTDEMLGGDVGDVVEGATTHPSGSSLSLETINGTQLKTYRLACAATGEYTSFFGGTVAAGQAAIVTAMNRVDGVYENELAVRMVLIANNSSLVFTNASTDPYTNNNGSAMLGQNQTTCDSIIGNANYDIGHVFSTGGGGIARLGVVGTAGLKAQGVTGLPAPTGDSFYIDFVAHEMGHQYGATHTFNSVTGNCGGGNRTASTAFEVGSGSTIMSYAGICGSDDLQPHSDPYFHWESQAQIVNYISSGNGLAAAQVTNTGNTPPNVSVPSSGIVLPARTPFALTATGSDADGDPLTFDWEEADLGPATTIQQPDNGQSPLFRSFSPTVSPTRYFRKLTDLINNTNTPNGEQFPATSRSLVFNVTARDNRSGGGGINTAAIFLTTFDTGAAFAVTSPNTGTTYNLGSTIPVTWNVAGTTANGINTASVRILLSTDGGQTFPTVLNSSTVNDGNESVTLPNTPVSNARIKVESIGNYFFDFSNVDFHIAAISQVPAQPSLQAGSDTGASQTDGITRLNNSSPANALSFDVGGTVPGATVSIYSDGTLLGTAVASGTTTTVTTNGTTTISNGIHSVTARQTEPGKPESSDSTPISITVDTVAPQLASTPSFDFAGGVHLMLFSFNEDLGAGINDGSLVLHNNTTNSNVPGHLDYTPNNATYSFPSQPQQRIPDGSYSASLTATDVAGNTVVGQGLPYNFLYVGGIAAHTIYIQRGGSGNSQVQVFKDTLPDGTPDFVADYATLAQVAFEGSESNDTVTVDYVNGDPIPPGFLAFRYVGHAGNDTLNVTNNGTFFFDIDPGLDTPSLSVNVSNTARVEFGSIRVHLNGLSVASNGFVNIPEAGFTVLLTKSLNISGGGKLDLNDNDMIIDYSGGTPLASIESFINSARAGGTWSGGGLTSSNARNRPQHNTTLGAIEGSDYKSIYGPSATFDSEPFDTTAILVKYTWYGDTDFNGKVNFDDYVRTDSGFNNHRNGWLNGDFDLNGQVNFDDYVLIDLAFNTQSGVL